LPAYLAHSAVAVELSEHQCGVRCSDLGLLLRLTGLLAAELFEGIPDRTRRQRVKHLALEFRVGVVAHVDVVALGVVGGVEAFSNHRQPAERLLDRGAVLEHLAGDARGEA
jgi:hypothetical protein